MVADWNSALRYGNRGGNQVKTLLKYATIIAVAAALAGCSGTPVKLGSKITSSVPAGTVRDISAEACGMQLLLLIPIRTNGRMLRAYTALETQAGGDFITDVQIQERWTYLFIGTNYCTVLHAKAIHPAS
jgi:hypothetical protein